MKNFFIKSIEGNNKWYLYILTLVLSFLGGQALITPVFIIYYAVIDFVPTTGDLVPPTIGGLIILLLTFVALLAALWFCIKFIHKKKFLSVLTGRSRLDFKRIGIGVGVWGAILLIYTVIEFITGNADSLVFQFDASEFFPLLIVCIILLPFQTSYEEILVRGYLMQGLFRLTKNMWVPFLVTSLLFAVMHGANTEVAAFGVWELMSYYFSMGLFLAAITIFDDGLELALGVHFVNNFFSFLFITTDKSSIKTPGSLFYDPAPTMGYDDVLYIVIMAIVFIFITQRILKYKVSLKK